MKRSGPAPIVRHSYASNPDPEKVRAALELWRQALARRMAQAGAHVEEQSKTDPAAADLVRACAGREKTGHRRTASPTQ